MFMGRDKGQESRALELLWKLFFRSKSDLIIIKPSENQIGIQVVKKDCSTKRIFVLNQISCILGLDGVQMLC